MSDTLSDICTEKRKHIAARKAEMPESRILEKIQQVEKPRGFKKALEAKIAQGKFALIAEIKKASPSGGMIRADFSAPALARAYNEGGAACLSVLTDMPYFKGHDDYLTYARAAVPLPALRKDFMLEPYQILESRLLGADCILLIMTALSDAQAKELEAAALALGMDVLIEVHDKAELDRALAHLKPSMLGINNRNLKTLTVDLSTSETLAKYLPKNILPISESGIHTNADLQRMKKSGFSCFLVGESLMRQADVTQATKTLLGN